jgi:tetratricopeptide (TPR) repeat protein
MRAIASVLAALMFCAAAAPGHEAGSTADDFREHALELLRARQAEKAAAFLQYGLGHYPLDVGLNLLYLDVLREEGIEIVARAWYYEEAEHFSDEAIISYALGRLAEDEEESRDCFERALAADEDLTAARVGLAELALRRGDVDGARRELEQALAQNADAWRAYALRGEISLAQGDAAEAVEDFERALAAAPYAPATHAALGEAYLLVGATAAARDEYREAIAWCDDRGEYYLGLARAQEALGEIDAARLTYATAASRASGDLAVAVAGRKAAGRLAFEAGDMVEAVDHLTWAATFAPEDAELHAYIGRLYLHVGRPAEAAAEFARATELEPENVEYENLYNLALTSAGEFASAEEAGDEVVELLMAGRRAEALAELEIGLEQYPLDNRLNLLYLDIVEEDGRADEALEAYEEKLARWGEEPIVLVALGRLTASIDLEGAESKYNRALEVGGPFSAAYVGLAEIGLRRGRAGHADAEKYVELSLATDSEYKRPYRIRGSICLLNDALEDAVSNFKLALEGEPYDPVARVLLAQTYADLGNHEAAVEEYRKAIYFNVTNPAYYLGLAGTLNYLGNFGEARRAYEVAASYVKGDDELKARTLEKAANLAVEEGDYAEAARYLADAVKLSPQDRSLRLSLSRALAEQGEYNEAINEIEFVLNRYPEDGFAWYQLGSALKAKGDLVRAESALANAVRFLPYNIEFRRPRLEAERELDEVRKALAELEKMKAEE